MTMNVLAWCAAFALALLFFCVRCDGNASAASSSVSAIAPLLSPPPLPPSPFGEPSDARTTAPLAKEQPAECSPPARVPPRVSVQQWPSRIGERVRLACGVVRAVGVTEYLVTADGVQFVILAEPGTPPCGPSTSTFIVAGSTRVQDHGRTSHPQLVVDTCGR